MIVIDSNEPMFIKNAFKSKVEIRRLGVGDFIAGGCVVERKTFDDFAASITDDRIYSQRIRLLSSNLRPIVAVVGLTRYSKFSPISDKSIFTSMADLASHGVSVLMFLNDDMLVHFIEKLEEKCNTVWKSPISVPFVSELNLRLFMCIPGIGEVNGRSLSKKFSFFDIPNIDTKLLMKIKGIGEFKAKQIKEEIKICKRKH